MCQTASWHTITRPHERRGSGEQTCGSSFVIGDPFVGHRPHIHWFRTAMRVLQQAGRRVFGDGCSPGVESGAFLASGARLRRGYPHQGERVCVGGLVMIYGRWTAGVPTSPQFSNKGPPLASFAPHTYS